MSRLQHLLRSSVFVILIYGLNKVTGLGKLFLLTARFGTSSEADAFAAAAQLPELLTAMLAGGALAAALIPVYTDYRLRQEDAAASALARTVFTLTLLVMGGVCLLAIINAEWLVRVVLLPGASPAQQALTAELMQIVLMSAVMIAVSGVLTSLLHAHQHFLAPAWATVAIDLGQIFGLAFLVPSMGIYGAAWGSVIGGMLLVAVQVPAYLGRGLNFRLGLDLSLPGTQEVLRLMGPRVVTLGAYQAVDLVFIRLASSLPDGIISAYFYANLAMVGMPRSLFSYAVTNVLFPTLAEQYNRQQQDDLRQTLVHGIRAIWMLVVPCAVGLLALGEPAVSFLFERGSFGPEATQVVYGLMAILSIRLIADSSQDVLGLIFYARHNTRTPMFITLGWMVLNLGLSVVLVGPLGGAGLAWAASISSLAAAVGFYLLGRERLNGLGEWQLARTVMHLGLASGAMAAIIFFLHSMALPQLTFLALGIGSGGLTFVLVTAAFNQHEVRQAVALFRQRATLPEPLGE